MEYKNDIKDKLSSVGQLYLAINKITEQYSAIMLAAAEFTSNTNNTNENGGVAKPTNDQLLMLQGAISDLDFKISIPPNRLNIFGQMVRSLFMKF